MSAPARRKIVFLAVNRFVAERFAHEDARRRVAEAGFDLSVPLLETGAERIDDWTPFLADADVLMTAWGSPRCTADFLKAAPKVRLVAHAAGSVAGVVDASTYAAGMTVVTANPTMAETVAEWSVMATLMAMRNVTAYAKLGPGQTMDWDRRGEMMDADACTLGIWGLGDISRHMLKLLAGYPFKRVLVVSKHAADGELAALGARRATLEEAFAQSDIVHCLAGKNAENTGRVGAKELALLRDGATLVNAGRAKLIQEEPLMAALKTGRFRAIFDVYYQEPLPADSPLQALDNVILTPHSAGSAVGRYVPYVLEDIRRFFAGEPLRAAIDEARYRTMTDESL